jgi:AraC-like DNA-binding protein
MSRRTTSAVWVKGISEVLAAEGLNVPALFEAAGLNYSDLDIPGTRFATLKISRLWELAAAWSGNPAIGLAQHQTARLASLDVVGYSMISCPNLIEGFDRFRRYLRILSDSLVFDMHEDGDGYRAVFELDGGNRPVPRQRMEFVLITLVTFSRWTSGREVHPLELELAYPEPVDIRPYRDAFRCNMLFNASRNSFKYSHADLTLPLPTSSQKMAEMHERFAGEYLASFDIAETSYRAREAIVRQLHAGEPRRDQIASALSMSERTLQRRLEEESTSFHRLLDDTRRELAEQYLGRLHLSLAQAAYLLGFAEQSSFFRACKRWFELSPGQFRDQLRNDRKSPSNDSVGNPMS